MFKRIQRLFTLFLATVLICSAGIYAPQASAEALTKDVLISLPEFSGATGVDLNLRLNPEFVQSAVVISYPEWNTVGDFYQNGEKLKVGMASATPFSGKETDGITLRLTLKKMPEETSELCKLLQMTVNEQVLWQASDCILLSGIEEGAHYRDSRTVTFNEGTATLNGQPFSSGDTVFAEGEYLLKIRDLTGRTREVSFVVDRTPPVITVSSPDPTPTRGPITVTASVNEGTLNVSSHTFTENGNFTFIATDRAGNQSEKTVSVTQIYKTYSATILNKPETVTVLEGQKIDVSGWNLKINYDNGMTDTFDVTSDMISYDTSVPGSFVGTLTYGNFVATFPFMVKEKQLVRISVTTKPSKLTYLEGDAFNSSGMVVTAYYDNGASETITGYTMSGYSSTVGTKTITVSYGGKTASFTVTVNSRVPSSITSNKHTVSGGNISKISTGTTVKTFLSNLNEGTYCKVFKGNTEVTGDAPVGTGMVVKLLDGATVKASCALIVTGDVNGDGECSVTDMISVKSHLLEKSNLSGVYATAADTNGDGSISITDFIQIKAYILGKGDIIAR